MSEYFRVLKRLEQDVPALPELTPVEAPVRSQMVSQPVRRADPPAQTLRAYPPATASEAAYVTLYDNIRATANGRPTHSLVFAGAAPGAPVQMVVQGLAARVRRLNQRVLVAELTVENGRPLLRTRTDATDAPVRGPDLLSVDLRSHAGTEDVRAWLEANSEADLVLIEADPLAGSLDAAMLACGCDGLVIVAVAGVTARKELQLAAERARAVDCRPLGLVVRAGTDRIPTWLRRILRQTDR